MEPLERKRRDFREREAQFMDEGRSILLEDGYHGLNIGRIAKATGFSRGTIYQHFTCKEDLILALVKRAMDRRLAMLERAGMFRGRPRERLTALGRALEIFAALYPDDVRILLIGNTEAILQKASEHSLREMRTCAHRTLSIPIGIVRDGIALGDLELRDGVTPEDVAYNFWAFTDGAYETAFGSWISPREIGVSRPVATAIAGCQVLCEGYHWRPLMAEWDYKATLTRVQHELFPEHEGHASETSDR